LKEHEFTRAAKIAKRSGFTGCGKTRRQTGFVKGHGFSRAVKAK
jgi:hypothetical protein